MTCPILMTFTNGKTWPIDSHNFIDAIGITDLDEVVQRHHEGFLDLLSEETVGNPLLMNIAYQVIGSVRDNTLILQVTGDASLVVESDHLTVGNGPYDTVSRLGVAFGWNETEITHARATRGLLYENEAVISLANGRELRCPSFPEPCSYVRVVHCGHELMCWHVNEWQADPADTMGAILGCTNGPTTITGQTVYDAATYT